MPDESEAKIDRLEELMRDMQELTEENNRLLRKVVRGNNIAFWSKLLLWAIVIILPLIFLKPILNTFIPITGIGSGNGGGVGVTSFPSPAEIQKLIQEYRDQGQK